MSISIVCNELLWEKCPWCHGDSRNIGPEGFCETCSNQGEVPIDVSDLATLAHNLAIVAALCRAFELGSDPSCLFYPGCQGAAP